AHSDCGSFAAQNRLVPGSVRPRIFHTALSTTTCVRFAGGTSTQLFLDLHRADLFHNVRDARRGGVHYTTRLATTRQRASLKTPDRTLRRLVHSHDPVALSPGTPYA